MNWMKGGRGESCLELCIGSRRLVFDSYCAKMLPDASDES